MGKSLATHLSYCHRSSGRKQIRHDTDKVRIFFTSQPLDKWVRDFRSMIARPTVTPPLDRGDVRLVYDAGGWNVQQHFVLA
jgi:hypothetical protein